MADQFHLSSKSYTMVIYIPYNFCGSCIEDIIQYLEAIDRKSSTCFVVEMNHQQSKALDQLNEYQIPFEHIYIDSMKLNVQQQATIYEPIVWSDGVAIDGF